MRNTNRILTVALAASCAILLASCGSSDEEATQPGVVASAPASDQSEDTAGSGTTDGSDDTQDTATSEDAATTAAGGGDTGPGTATGDAAGGDADIQGVLDAIALAESEAGGTAYEIDDEDDDTAWEISVAAGDQVLEVTVSADGTEVLGTESDGSLDDDDRQAVDTAGISLGEAIVTALAEVDGNLDDVEVDDDGGTVSWEVTVDQGDVEHEIYVDVVTGEVLRVSTD